MKKDYDSEVDKYLLKIASETHRIRQIFESCTTMEHVDNTNRLSCFLIDKWYRFAGKYGIFTAADKIWPMIRAAADDMELFYRKAKARVK